METMESSEVPVDEMLKIVGGFGLYQWIRIAAFCIIVLPVTYPVLIMYFLTLKSPWRCKQYSTVCTYNGTIDPSNTSYCSLPTTEWEYTEPRDFSIVTKFNISCGNEWLLEMATTIFFVGAAVGGVMLGKMADRYGRKTVFFPSLLILILISFISAFVPNIYMFIGCRFIAGVFYAGCLAGILVLVTEFIDEAHRPFGSNCVWLCYAMALCIMTLKACFIKQWKILVIVCTIPYAIVLLFYKVIPESIHWLLQRDRTTEVMGIFKSIAKTNNRSIPINIVVLHPHDTEEKGSGFKDLFKPLSFARTTMIQAYGWFATSVSYYGLSLAADELGGSMYRNFVLVSLMEFPANMAGAYLCNRFGRKKTAVIPLFLGTACCVAIPIIPMHGNIKIARVVLGMFGKFFVTMCYSCMYLWSAEIYPTNIRAAGVGFMQIFEMTGGACSPFIAKGLERIYKNSPFFVFGAISFIGSVLLTLLPETKGRSLQ